MHASPHTRHTPQHFVNPYDHGWRANWRRFLGLNRRRSLLWVLLPSWHRPDDDGVTWGRTLPPMRA